MILGATPSAAAPRVAAGAAICGLALLTFFQFPGHTWLQQDMQIYAPILEHLRDPGALDRDLVVQYPHVSFTLYDELALGVQRATGLDFKHVLGAEQIVCRALGIWGIFLMATAAGLDTWAALLAASIFSLGAMIAGPSVLTFEYEPTPRALAIPLLLCAIGMVSRKRYTAAGIAAAAAFLIHPPSTVPFWIALLCISFSLRTSLRTAVPSPALPRPALVVERGHRGVSSMAGKSMRLIGLGGRFAAGRAWPAWAALLCAIAVITVAAHLQPGLREQQEFFTRLTPQQEGVQRMRTAYNWISIWWRGLLPQYVALYALAMLAYARVKAYLTPELRVCSVILPAMGMLSMPLSYLLLERLKWSLVPQLQPMRVLLYVTAFTVILGSVAALKATRILESAAWLALVYYIPMRVQLFDAPTLRLALTAIGLSAFTAAALRLPRPALAIAGALAFFIIPGIGGVSNYPNLHTGEIADLSHWARDNTPRAAMFLFPDAGHLLYPGLFRVDAMRAVYVDWKSGGQVNYLKDFAGEWGTRWDAMNREGFGAAAIPCYRSLGIDYLVLRQVHRLPGIEPVYGNSQYAVYRITE